jgi:hypothetical protein
MASNQNKEGGKQIEERKKQNSRTILKKESSQKICQHCKKNQSSKN